MNEELMAKLEDLTQAITTITEKIAQIEEHVNELDSVLYDGIVAPANEAIAEQEYDAALSDFRMKFAEKLDDFVEPTKAIEGEGFDVFKEVFDSYNESDTDMAPSEFVEKVAESLTEQIDTIREALAEKAGVDPEDIDVEVKTEGGETVIEAEVDEDKGEGADEDDELAKFEEELRKEADKDSGSWVRL